MLRGGTPKGREPRDPACSGHGRGSSAGLPAAPGEFGRAEGRVCGVVVHARVSLRGKGVGLAGQKELGAAAGLLAGEQVKGQGCWKWWRFSCWGGSPTPGRGR